MSNSNFNPSMGYSIAIFPHYQKLSSLTFWCLACHLIYHSGTISKKLSCMCLLESFISLSITYQSVSIIYLPIYPSITSLLSGASLAFRHRIHTKVRAFLICLGYKNSTVDDSDISLASTHSFFPSFTSLCVFNGFQRLCSKCFPRF